MKWLSIILLTVLLPAPYLRASGHKDAWLAKATRMKLGDSSEWKRLLLYVPRWLAKPTSMADQNEFFIANDGAWNSSRELSATIEAFFAPWNGSPDLHPVCRYPRRLKFIESSLQLKLPSEFQQPCQAYSAWRAEHPVSGMSLVFASNYLNNPASLYGHTFLRLHRQRDDGTGSSPLLDYAVNFAANPTTVNPMIYALYGMTGRFFGTFSLMPYYIKVQEYNNAESRDLFEYPLNFSDDEVDSFMRMLWEVGPYGIRYWYMDENCSYVLLTMLAATRPELDVVDQFPGVVSPKDTLLVLRPTNLLGTPVRRPSAMTRFKVRRSNLSPSELQIVENQIKHQNLVDDIKNADPESKARMLDAVSAWIAWDEKLAGSKMPEKKSALWSQSLSERANLKIMSPSLDLSKNPVTPPDEGHQSHRTYFSYRAIEGHHSEFMFGLRLTLHDFLSPPAGYAPDQETTMGDIQGVIRKKDDGSIMVEWERFIWLRIFSAPGYDSMLSPVAWTLTAQTQRMWGYGVDPWLSHRVEGGAGFALGNESGDIHGWLIPVMSVGHLLPKMDPAVHGGVGLRSGLAFDAASKVRLAAGWNFDLYGVNQKMARLNDVYFGGSYLHEQKNEFRLMIHARNYSRQRITRSGEVTWMLYF